MEITDSQWNAIQRHFGYTDEEMEFARSNPKIRKIISKTELITTKIVFTVVDSHGCGSHHRVGDKIYFDGFGQLISTMNPTRICAFAVSAMAELLLPAQELLWADLNPNDLKLKRVGCHDVGIKNGGFGHVIFELSVE